MESDLKAKNNVLRTERRGLTDPEGEQGNLHILCDNYNLRTQCRYFY